MNKFNLNALVVVVILDILAVAGLGVFVSAPLALFGAPHPVLTGLGVAVLVSVLGDLYAAKRLGMF